jgi:hypothetical protein
MSSDYPNSLDTLATNHARNQKIRKEHINDLADAMNKVQAELGTSPSGSFSTVKDRLDAIGGTTGLATGSGTVSIINGAFSIFNTTEGTDEDNLVDWSDGQYLQLEEEGVYSVTAVFTFSGSPPSGNWFTSVQVHLYDDFAHTTQLAATRSTIALDAGGAFEQSGTVIAKVPAGGTVGFFATGGPSAETVAVGLEFYVNKIG